MAAEAAALRSEAAAEADSAENAASTAEIARLRFLAAEAALADEAAATAKAAGPSATLQTIPLSVDVRDQPPPPKRPPKKPTPTPPPSEPPARRVPRKVRVEAPVEAPAASKSLLPEAPKVVSSRRVLDGEGDWQRALTQRIDTPARRSRVGLRAEPLSLARMIWRSVPDGIKKRRKEVGSTYKVPKLDLSQMALLYSAGDSLAVAAMHSLDARTLSARLPHGPLRPLSRQLPMRMPALTERVPDTALSERMPLPKLSHTALPPPPPAAVAFAGAPCAASAPAAPSAVAGSTHDEGSRALPTLGGAAGGAAGGARLPAGWVILCQEREQVVEQALNMALRLGGFYAANAAGAGPGAGAGADEGGVEGAAAHNATHGAAHGAAHGAVALPSNVVRAAAECLTALRRTGVAIVEALLSWQAAVAAASRRTHEHRHALEQRRQRLLGEKRSLHALRQRRLRAAARDYGDVSIAESQPPPRRQKASAADGDAPAAPAAAGKFPGLRPAAAAQQSVGLSRLRSDLSGGSGGGGGCGGKDKEREGWGSVSFSSYTLHYATAAPGSMQRSREAAGLWDGHDYLLKLLSDVWRLPLPSMSDPFALRWFEPGSPFAPTTEELPRLRAAETALHRLVTAKQAAALSAVEVGVALRLQRLPERTPFGAPAEVVAEAAAAANWRVLASVFYGDEGVAGFMQRKRHQWRAERAAAMCQMSYRRTALLRRVRMRMRAKEEAAARVVQYYYKNKLLVGGLALKLVNLAHAQMEKERERRAAELVRRRQEERLRLGERAAAEKRERRLRALRSALREYAAGDFLTRVMRGALSRMVKRRLKLKQSAFLRNFSADGTGHALNYIVKFQRRVRLWLAHNELFQSLYEEHRHALLMQRTAPEHHALEAFLDAREPGVTRAFEAAHAAVATSRPRLRELMQAQLRVSRGQGELAGLLQVEEIEGQRGGLPLPSGGVPEAKRLVAAASSKIEAASRHAETAMAELEALVSRRAQCAAAQALAAEIEISHPISYPMLLGMSLLLGEGSRRAAADAAAATEALRGAWKALETASTELAISEAQAKPSEVQGRRDRASRLAARMPSLRAEAAEAMHHLPVHHELLGVLAAATGERHVLALVRQRCQWRRWGMARMERITALTVLRGTRAPAKQYAALQRTQAEARGMASVLDALAPCTRSPPCSLVLRPAGLSSLPPTTTAASLLAAIREHLLPDLAEACGVHTSRFERLDVAFGSGGSAEMGELGLELLAQDGAIDFGIRIHHEEGSSSRDSTSLLHQLHKELPYGEVPMRRLARALRMHPAQRLEFRVVSTDEPPVQRVNVRRVLSEQLEGCKAEAQAARSALDDAIVAKRNEASKLLPGCLGMRTKPIKLRLATAKGAQKQCEGLLKLVPERASDDDETLQFEWLPSVIAEAREKVDAALSECEGPLGRLLPCVEQREVGKRALSEVTLAMSVLSAVESLPVEPPLENAGKLITEELHGAFYQHRDLVYARRTLACAISHFAAKLTFTVAGLVPKVGGNDVIGEVASSPIGARRASAVVMAGGPGGGLGGKGFVGPFGGKGGGVGRSGPKTPSVVVGAKRTAGAGGGLRVLDPEGSLARVKATMLLTPNPSLWTPPKATRVLGFEPERSGRRAQYDADRASAGVEEGASANEAAPVTSLITPERVVEMCATLGIALGGGEPEYHLAWLAVEALAAPLPPLWRRLERPKSAAESAVSGAEAHPGRAPPSPSPLLKPRQPAATALVGGTPSLTRSPVGGAVHGSAEMQSQIPSQMQAAGLASPRHASRALEWDLSYDQPPLAGRGTDDQYYYEHTVSGALLAEHPLLPVFAQMVASERRRRDKPRPWTSVEDWMLFAGENETIVFFSLASRTRTREVPAELLTEQQRLIDFRSGAATGAPMPGAVSGPRAAPPSQATLARARKEMALGRRPNLREEHTEYGVLGGVQGVGGGSGVGGCSAAVRAAAKQKSAELTKASHHFRHASLQVRPRGLPEVLVAASRLKVDIFAQPAMLWLCDAILATDYLPIAWTKHSQRRDVLERMGSQQTDAQGLELFLGQLSAADRLRFTALGEVPKYHHALLQASTEQHPLEAVAKDVERYLCAAPGRAV